MKKLIYVSSTLLILLALLFVVSQEGKSLSVVTSDTFSNEFSCYGTWTHQDGSTLVLYKNGTWEYEDIDGAYASGSYENSAGYIKLNGKYTGYFDCHTGKLQVYIQSTTYGGQMYH